MSKRKQESLCVSCTLSNKVSKHSSVYDTDDSNDAQSMSSSQYEDTAKLVMVRRYCLIFSETADDSMFMSTSTSGSSSNVDAPVVARVAAVVDRVKQAAAASGVQMVPHKFTLGVEVYALNAEDGELWCSVPESCVEELREEFGDALECVVEEYAF